VEHHFDVHYGMVGNPDDFRLAQIAQGSENDPRGNI